MVDMELGNPFVQREIWFITGSQHLYGEGPLKQVDDHSKTIVQSLNHAGRIPVTIIHKPVLTTPDAITRLMLEANAAEQCVGLIAWMHTFSPAKMWIQGLKILQKPYLHLHTQFNRDIPWASIDMDFMNLNQSAHGGREFGFINARMDVNRKVVVGHWENPQVQERISVWSRVATAWSAMQEMKVARFGDNMRQVAVTEGNKVGAQMQLGFAVNGYGVGDLVEHIHQVSDSTVDTIIGQYYQAYEMVPELGPGGSRQSSLKEAARIEAGLRSFLTAGGFTAFTDTFEDLHGLVQLPGIAVQRLMADGYGFGGEGDWKTAALVRAMKVMGYGLAGGNSFMEDYTYHFEPGNEMVLGAHMLEICPSITSQKPKCAIHPLGIGGKADPVRLVFDADGGPGLNASLIDLGSRFRLLVNLVDGVEVAEAMPKLPVARVLWKPQPSLATAATTWILAGGAHHTCFSQSLTLEFLEDFADIARIELVVIDNSTQLRTFKNELRWNQVYYHLQS